MIEGIILVRTQLLSVLQEEGLERIPVLGLPYDPSVAEAVETRPVTEPEHHHVVVKELMRGYRLHGTSGPRRAGGRGRTSPGDGREPGRRQRATRRGGRGGGRGDGDAGGDDGGDPGRRRRAHRPPLPSSARSASGARLRRCPRRPPGRTGRRVSRGEGARSGRAPAPKVAAAKPKAKAAEIDLLKEVLDDDDDG